MNPDPSVGGIVNIGLWLAVADPGQVSITASVGPVWATVTARYESTTWDFGNGDSMACDGLGTPIVDKDDGGAGAVWLHVSVAVGAEVHRHRRSRVPRVGDGSLGGHVRDVDGGGGDVAGRSTARRRSSIRFGRFRQ